MRSWCSFYFQARRSRSRFIWSLVGLGSVILISQTQAGVFSLPHLVNPGQFAIGFEPGFVMTGGAAMDINLKYTHGISESNNLTGIVGTGGGARQFRIGGSFSFDLFPDLVNQPGFGIAIQSLFVQLAGMTGSLETTAIPYVHKSFNTIYGVVEPFLAVPMGLVLFDGFYRNLSTVVVGSLFEYNEHIRSVFEFGVTLNHTQTYLSGGIVYYH